MNGILDMLGFLAFEASELECGIGELPGKSDLTRFEYCSFDLLCLVVSNFAKKDYV